MIIFWGQPWGETAFTSGPETLEPASGAFQQNRLAGNFLQRISGARPRPVSGFDGDLPG
jgi:hypothetical protein